MAPPPQPPRAVLVWKDGPRMYRHEFDNDSILIGSHPDNDIVVGAPGVSTFHCRVAPEESGHTVFDCETIDGLRVDGRRVRSARLGWRAEIEIGTLRFHYRVVEPRAANDSYIDERGVIEATLRELGGNIRRSAGRLHMPESTLRSKINRWGLSASRRRGRPPRQRPRPSE